MHQPSRNPVSSCSCVEQSDYKEIESLSSQLMKDVIVLNCNNPTEVVKVIHQPWCISVLSYLIVKKGYLATYSLTYC